MKFITRLCIYSDMTDSRFEEAVRIYAAGNHAKSDYFRSVIELFNELSVDINACNL